MLRLVFFCLCICSSALAQYRIGVIISQSGQSLAIGQAQVRAVQHFKDQLGRFASEVELLVRDDASFPAETLKQAQDLIENQHVLALVCCSSSSNLKAISAYLSQQPILTLSPNDLPDSNNLSEPSWMLSTKPSLYKLLQSIILHLSDQGQQSLGVMTPENSVGSDVQKALSLLLSPGGIRLAVLQTYAVDSAVLTPEALWVATRLPESILVWGGARDSVLAYQALRERGFEGNVILNPNGINLSEVEGAHVVLSPLQVASSLAITHPNYQNSLDFANQIRPINMDTAYLYDALDLLKAALEQVYTFGIPTDNLPALRYALRDALIGLGAITGVAATYDYSETDPIGVMPLSLVMGKVNQGKLVFVP